MVYPGVLPIFYPQEHPYKDCSSLEDKELNHLKEGAALAAKLGLKVNAGHGLTYENVHRMHGVFVKNKGLYAFNG